MHFTRGGGLTSVLWFVRRDAALEGPPQLSDRAAAAGCLVTTDDDDDDDGDSLLFPPSRRIGADRQHH